MIIDLTALGNKVYGPEHCTYKFPTAIGRVYYIGHNFGLYHIHLHKPVAKTLNTYMYLVLLVLRIAYWRLIGI